MNPQKVATPAKAGVQCFCNHLIWIPAFAGMTFVVDFRLVTKPSKFIGPGMPVARRSSFTCHPFGITGLMALFLTLLCRDMSMAE